jgi:hypothetical protein
MDDVSSRGVIVVLSRGSMQVLAAAATAVATQRQAEKPTGRLQAPCWAPASDPPLHRLCMTCTYPPDLFLILLHANLEPVSLLRPERLAMVGPHRVRSAAVAGVAVERAAGRLAENQRRASPACWRL